MKIVSAAKFATRIAKSALICVGQPRTVGPWTYRTWPTAGGGWATSTWGGSLREWQPTDQRFSHLDHHVGDMMYCILGTRLLVS